MPAAQVTPEVAGRIGAGVLAATGGVEWSALGVTGTSLAPLLVPRPEPVPPSLVVRVRRVAGRGLRKVRPAKS
jgi:hypothetical protein